MFFFFYLIVTPLLTGTFKSLFHVTQNLYKPEVLSRYNGPDTVNISIILYNYISQSPFAFVYNRIQGLTVLVVQILSGKSTINALYNYSCIQQSRQIRAFL
jgi:hypothetical protein